MGRPLGKKFNGKVSINVTTFTRAALEVEAARMGVTVQEAVAIIVKDHVEAYALEDAVALRALEMVQADAPAPVDERPWIDAGTPPPLLLDVELLVDNVIVIGYHADHWWSKYLNDRHMSWEECHPTAWREIAPAPLVEAVDAPAELQGD